MYYSKRIRGSAFTTMDGTFTFTPYAVRPHGVKNHKVVKSGTYSSLWIGKNTVSAKLTFNRKAIPPFQVWIEEMTNMYNSLYQSLLE